MLSEFMVDENDLGSIVKDLDYHLSQLAVVHGETNHIFLQRAITACRDRITSLTRRPSMPYSTTYLASLTDINLLEADLNSYLAQLQATSDTAARSHLQRAVDACMDRIHAIQQMEFTGYLDN